MRRLAVLATTALGFVATALARGPPDSKCAIEGLGYVTCKKQFPQHCVEQASNEAVAFCSGYLSAATKTVTVTTTSLSTVVKTSTSTSVSTRTKVTTTIITSPTSTTTVFTVAVPELLSTSTSSAVIRRDGARGCPRLNEKVLSRKPAAKISSVCSCLGVTATTVTKSTTRTATFITTSTTQTRTVSTTTSLTTVTSTTGAVATQTSIIDPCEARFSVEIDSRVTGNRNEIISGITSKRDCCISCWQKLNCLVGSFVSNQCTLIIKEELLSGAPVSNQCPLGKEDVGIIREPGAFFPGPCTPPPAREG